MKIAAKWRPIDRKPVGYIRLSKAKKFYVVQLGDDRYVIGKKQFEDLILGYSPLAHIVEFNSKRIVGTVQPIKSGKGINILFIGSGLLLTSSFVKCLDLISGRQPYAAIIKVGRR